jgi:hypothetical protein
MAKKISCRVVKTSLINCAPDAVRLCSPQAALFKAGSTTLTTGWEEYCNSERTEPMVRRCSPQVIGFNLFKQIKEKAAKPTSSLRYAGQAVERRAKSRSFDFYA